MAKYCASDWHGNFSVAKQILDFLKPDDELYYLGDAIDRGADGWKILQMLLSDPRVTFIKGNHEDIMQAYYDTQASKKYLMHWYDNGGEPTHKAMQEEEEETVLSTLDKIRSLPLRIDLDTEKGHLILTHAGCWPMIEELMYPASYLEEKYLWDRQHWKYPEWDHRFPDTYIVHGHTPVEILEAHKTHRTEIDKNFIPTVQFYCEGHKVDLDMGTYYTGTAALLNLDTFEVKYFKE